jgi:4-diphosphocytidyl-2-C-methyl-D-erythritol kinase
MNFQTAAKINLNLKIFPLNEGESLHNLESDMVPISLFDTISIEENEFDEILFNREELNGIESTLHTSLKLMREVNPKFSTKFKIYVEKNIPHGAGLGGGSSNAGGLINFLIDKYDLKTPDYKDIANYIGSDVPFFVNNKPAKISGVGDIITELTLDNVDELLLAVPKLHIKTGDVFNSFDKRVKEGFIDKRNAYFSNDLWEAAVEIEPKLGQKQKELNKYFNREFVMSGSGSSFFAPIDNIDFIESDIKNLDLQLFSICKKIDSCFFPISD